MDSIFRVRLSCFGTELTAIAQRASPQLIRIIAGVASPTTSAASGSALSSAIAGSASQVTVTFKDQFSNVFTANDYTQYLQATGSSAVSVSFDPSSGIGSPSVTDNADGTMTVSYTLTTAGSYQMTISQALPSNAGGTGTISTSSLVVKPGAVAASQTTLINLPSEITAGVSQKVIIRTKDASGNDLQGPLASMPTVVIQVGRFG